MGGTGFCLLRICSRKLCRVVTYKNQSKIQVAVYTSSLGLHNRTENTAPRSAAGCCSPEFGSGVRQHPVKKSAFPDVQVKLSLRIHHRRWFSSSSPTQSLFRGTGGSEQKQQLLEDIARKIRNRECNRIVVMAGAGISTPSGIPDFRSPGSGLYDNLRHFGIPYPEAVFEINYFLHDPKPFYSLAKELYPGNYKPNWAHYFVRLLYKKGMLLRMYTQNIDGLERLAGIPPSMLVEAHGSFATASCTVCCESYPGENFRDEVMEGKVPLCPICTGVIKPDIIFFGQELPKRFFLYLTDFPLADLLIIMGTSLEVEPFASLAGAVRSSVTRLLINRDLVGPFSWYSRSNDVVELGEVIGGVRKFVDLLGWKEEMKDLIERETEKKPKKRTTD
ncbi:NAD-dependent protein deacetylase sirtuin-3 isoform X2 [Latimeria chalumnae]|uniref:NAD-dependent protein deacetylase sirtuin-3 isoform X2 n=1 Tax=Latimeria chalumnae TaxID=7897 RepID=UPI0003C1784B|nr:PREDICTED: NAD-dependent protein deacetylase sirtuin-3, mitochondrial isoform X2 [Latimeria chalumnae]|eukprot:XP_006009776.1 PREDICTED: NAD-dependent protein deacetylase sirtuin-3, mitochondrial isoform X2 [Latimeria chalumnae]